MVAARAGLLPLDDNPAAGNGGLSSALSLIKVKLREVQNEVIKDGASTPLIMARTRTLVSATTRMVCDAGGFDFSGNFVFGHRRGVVARANLTQNSGQVLRPITIERFTHLLPFVGIQRLNRANQLIEIELDLTCSMMTVDMALASGRLYSMRQ